METDMVRLIRRFIQLNTDMVKGYVNLGEYLETYLALDLLSDREFQPIVLMLSAVGVDFFFVLGVVFALSERLDKAHFSELNGHLDLKDNRLILNSPTNSERIEEFQACADSAAAHSMELGSAYRIPQDCSVPDSPLN